MKKIITLFFFLLALAMISYGKGYAIGGFHLSKVHNYFYFQSWISLAILVFCLVISYATYSVYKNTKLVGLKFVPVGLFFLSLGIIIIGFHNSYCKVCSDLGFCGTAHNYPNAISVLAVCISLVIYLALQSQDYDLKSSLKKFWHTLVFGSFIIIIILFISLFYMELPEPISYKAGRFNLQGFVFISISIFCTIAFFTFLVVYYRTRKKIFVAMSVQFIVTALVQLVAAYHIFTCYWCDIEECSEFFALGGIFILIGMFILWYSYTPILYGKSEEKLKLQEKIGALKDEEKPSKENIDGFSIGFLFAISFVIFIFGSFNVAYV